MNSPTRELVFPNPPFFEILNAVNYTKKPPNLFAGGVLLVGHLLARWKDPAMRSGVACIT
ncbi:hypothetical protein NYA28ABAC_02460 [Salinicola sp. NYA28a]